MSQTLGVLSLTHVYVALPGQQAYQVLPSMDGAQMRLGSKVQVWL